MSTTQRALDTQELEQRVKEMYREVAEEPDKEFHFETGRQLAERLGYPAAELDAIPTASIDSFAGVGYHFDLARVSVGDQQAIPSRPKLLEPRPPPLDRVRLDVKRHRSIHNVVVVNLSQPRQVGVYRGPDVRFRHSSPIDKSTSELTLPLTGHGNLGTLTQQLRLYRQVEPGRPRVLNHPQALYLFTINLQRPCWRTKRGFL